MLLTGRRWPRRAVVATWTVAVSEFSFLAGWSAEELTGSMASGVAGGTVAAGFGGGLPLLALYRRRKGHQR